MTALLDGQRAFITGGASGIGAELARRFTREGATVVVADINDALGRAVATEVNGSFVHLDVTDSTQWNQVVAAHEPFDIVALNAGVSTNQHVVGGDMPTQPLEIVDDERYRRIMKVNVDGVVFGARAVIPSMIERRNGHILVTASLAGLIPIPPDPIYGLTKHAMVGLVKSLGVALAPHNVCISALCPGFIDTPLVSEVAKEFAKMFSIGVMEVEAAGDLAMTALDQRIPGSQWVAMLDHPIKQYVPAPPY
jgi:NAD(P)-dependent dehydrogenase (short-subunit alcohol dehydrogenase family)